MHARIILLCLFLCTFATASAAQRPRERIYLDAVPAGRIDLDMVSESGSFGVVFARVSFVENDRSRCPEDSGALQVSGGAFMQMRMALPTDIEGNGSSNGWRSTLDPVDDETYQYRVILPNCRTDVAIRQQVRREGSWMALLVRKELRPSVPVEERRELERQRVELERQRNESDRERYRNFLSILLGELRGKEMSDFDAARKAAVATATRQKESHHEVLTFRAAFFFDDAPPACFTAIGNYRVERAGVIFSFLAPPDVIIHPPPPGGVNRFLIERADIDETRGRLYFTRGDCRLELTVSQSVLRYGQWISVPLALVPPPR
jgi:hypothetical protein